LKHFFYGWVIVVLGMVTNIFAVGIPQMCMPVFFKVISQDLNLSLVEIGVAWGLGGFASMLTSPFGGLLSDRFGYKRVLSIACIVAGIAGAYRGLAINYPTLMIGVFGVGFIQNSIILTTFKAVGVWFTDRNVVLCNGIVSAGIAFGMMTGAMISDSIMSPLLGGWRHVLFLYGAITILLGFLWAITRKEPAQKKHGPGADMANFFISVRQVLREKIVWLFSWIHFCALGGIMGVIGYLPLYLRSMGWDPTHADSALAVLNASGMLAAVPLSFLSSKYGYRKGIIIPLLALGAFCVFLIPFSKGNLIWLLVVGFGLLRDGYVAVLMAMVIESKKIGPAFAGTAMGIIISAGNLGIFITAPIGNRLAVGWPGFGFIFWAALLLISALIFIFPVPSRKKETPS